MVTIQSLLSPAAEHVDLRAPAQSPPTVALRDLVLAPLPHESTERRSLAQLENDVTHTQESEQALSLSELDTLLRSPSPDPEHPLPTSPADRDNSIFDNFLRSPSPGTNLDTLFGRPITLAASPVDRGKEGTASLPIYIDGPPAVQTVRPLRSFVGLKSYAGYVDLTHDIGPIEHASDRCPEKPVARNRNSLRKMKERRIGIIVGLIDTVNDHLVASLSDEESLKGSKRSFDSFLMDELDDLGEAMRLAQDVVSEIATQRAEVSRARRRNRV